MKGLSEKDELLMQNYKFLTKRKGQAMGTTSQGLRENHKLLAQICKVSAKMTSFYRNIVKA